MLSNTESVLLLIAIVVIYMLPGLIAFGRDHPKRQTIVVLNILFGWTLIVWFVLFLWASLARTEVYA